MPAPDGLIPTEALRNYLRELGFKFERQADRVMIWRRGTDRVTINRKDYISVETARCTLAQCGVLPGEIQRFLAIYCSS